MNPHLVILVSSLLSLVPAIGLAQSTVPYPSKPIRIIVAFPAGSGVDASTRFFAGKMSQLMGQSIVVENRPGASGVVGTEAAAKATPDGYAMFMAPPTTVMLPYLYSKVPYNVARDFDAVSLLNVSNAGIIAHPSVAAKDALELISLSKKAPLNAATVGVGSNHHLYGAWFALLTGANVNFIAYNTAAPLNDLVAGHTQVMFDALSAAVGLVNSGKLKVLAMTGKSRHHSFPNVPTFSELNIPDYEPLTWSGILVPAGTPTAIVNQLSSVAATVARSPDAIERYRMVGGEALGSTPAEFSAFLRAEEAKWSKVIKSLNIHLD